MLKCLKWVFIHCLLENFTREQKAGYVDSFYRNLADNVDNFIGSDFYGRIANDSNIPPEDVQKYILATSDFAKGMQTDINHYVTRDRINNASFRQKLDPISENILRRQNPLELVFEDISTFDAENPIVGSLLRELDVGKKNLSSDLIKQAPTPPVVDIAIRNRLNRLRGRQKPKDDNNLSPPPSPPAFPPPPAPGTSHGFPLPPPPSFQALPESFLDSTRPQQFRPDSSFGNFHIPAQLPSANFNRNEKPSGNLFGSLTQVKEKFVQNSVQKELDDTFYELPDPPELELGDGLLNTLGVKADDILEQKFVNQKQQEDAVLEQIKEEYNFDKIKDAFDEGTIPQQLDFFYGGENSSFNRKRQPLGRVL